MKRVLTLCTVFFAIGCVGCATSVNPAFEANDAGSDTRTRLDSAIAADSGTPMDNDTSVVEEDTAIPTTDTGVPSDTSIGFDTKMTDTGVFKFDTAVPPSDGATEDLTVGNTCTTDGDCDVTGFGINICTKGAFSTGSLYPTSVCIGSDCDPGTTGTVAGCDGDRGVCLATSSGGICLPSCEFDDTGAAAKGCAGKNKCNAYAFDSSAGVIGIGYCFGGCKADTDCPSGESCQVEDGLCVKTKLTFTKTPGTACTDADAKAPAKCNCLYTTAEKAGYCANGCYFGETTCATGFTCDPSLPRMKLLSTDTVFTKVPTGLAGNCLKNCTSDTDCAGLNSYCAEMAGTGKKTCQVGKRPCAKTSDCPTGVTCTGATTTTLGRCG